MCIFSSSIVHRDAEGQDGGGGPEGVAQVRGDGEPPASRLLEQGHRPGNTFLMLQDNYGHSK